MLGARTAAWSGKPLPYDSEIEYLGSTAMQYFNTGVVVTSTTRIRVLASFETTTNGFIFGSHADSTYIGVQYYSGIGLRVFCGRASEGYNQSGFVAGTAYIYEIDNENGAISIDGATVKTTGNSGGVGGMIYAFRINTQTEGASCNIYSIEIWDNNILVRDLIPVRKVNIGYMYDRVSGQFFGNEGTGYFVVGPDKTT